MDRAVFLDKDGTIVEDVPYNVDPDLVRVAPGVVEGLRALAQAGYRLVVVTNQSGVARGLFGEPEVEAIAAHVADVLAREGIGLDGFYFCPHLPDGSVQAFARACDCRKPEPGLVRQACAELHIDPARSWMVGDIASDIEAGRAAGCRTALVNAEPGRELDALGEPPDVVAPDLAVAAREILASDVSLGEPLQLS